LMISAKNGWIIGFDNLSTIQPWLSDTLCRLSTGGGFATRTLYEDSEETLFDAQRPVILTGIEDLATRSDLLDRCIVLYLPVITDDKRMPEAEFQRQFQACRARILGALLDAVACAIGGEKKVALERLPRLADFAVWITAAEPALGWQKGRFMEAYKR